MTRSRPPSADRRSEPGAAPVEAPAQAPAEASSSAADRIHVLVGLLRDARGRWLVNRRRAGTHEAGAWEFPGGKREPGESVRAALDRELAEELGIVVVDAEPFMRLAHDYADRRVLLDIWHVVAYEGRPRPLEAQALRWVRAGELDGAGLLAADRPIIDGIRATFGA